MLDYKVGHYVHQKDVTYQQNHNIPRFFMFLKQKFFPDGTMVPMASWWSVSSPMTASKVDIFMTLSLQPPYPYKSYIYYFNIALYYLWMLHTVDMRGSFLNAEFSSVEKPIY